MRIIAGVAKGRKLRAPTTTDTRPVTDRVREAVFSMIGSAVSGAATADLYAGSGSFGLEALSRGAATVVFVERAPKALEALRANVAGVGLGGAIVAGSVEAFLERATETLDLVFVDPPWSMDSGELGAQLGALDRILRPGGQVVASRRSSDPALAPPPGWRVATDRRYGDTRIFRYEKDAG